MKSLRSAAYARVAIGSVLCLGLGGVAHAQTTTKTFIDYFRPTPVTCPLTANAWGCTATGGTPPNCSAGMGVVPRDTCNGIESATNPPGYYYWDGSIILAPDGTYHLFADRWAGSNGFNPGWLGSDPIHAVGGTNPLGPYTDKGYAYSDGSFGNDSHHGHNSEVVTLLNGTYAMIVSEVVPFTVFTASSLNGPWTPCSGSPGAGLSVPSAFGGNTSYASNVSLVVRPDGDFEIIQRHGLIALSTSGICGPYKAQQPTNTYPSSETIPAQYSASIYPNRKKHLDSMAPSTVESTYTLAEDPVIWFSGGQYHVLYDYPDDRVGYYLSSSDGIHDWTDQGLAYDPRYAQKIFSYADGTVDHWFKMERPGVLVENGHVTHLTFAVSDVDKNNQISAGTDHGSKVIVVPFDGVTFDSDMGVGGAGAGGMGGSSGTGGAGGKSGTSGAGGKSGTGGAGGNSGGSAGAAGAGGRPTGTGGSTASVGASGSGVTDTGSVTAGSGDMASSGNGAGGLATGGGENGNGATGSGAQGDSESGVSEPSGCSCSTLGSTPARVDGRAFALAFIVFGLLRRRRRAKTLETETASRRFLMWRARFVSPVVWPAFATLVLVGCGSSGSDMNGTGGQVGSGGPGETGGGGMTGSTGMSGTQTGTGGRVAGSGGSGVGTGGRTGTGGSASATAGSVGTGAAGTAASTGTGGSNPGSGGSGVGGMSATGTGGTGTTGTGGSGVTAGMSSGCGKAPTIASSSYNSGKPISITAANMMRRYILSVPTNYDNTRAYKLVIAFHQRDGNDVQMYNQGYYGLRPLADDTTIFVAPNGQLNGAPCSGTGNGEASCGWPNPNNSDFELADAVVAEVEENFCVDTGRIFATGWSYGGAMSYETSCARPLSGGAMDYLRAIAVYSGSPQITAGPCPPTKPVAYYASHGTQDNVLPYSGGVSMAQNYAKANGCTWTTPTMVTSGNHVCTSMTGCMTGYPVEFCSFNGPHTPTPTDPGQKTSWEAQNVWTFLAQF